jgi:hypothetical protein
MGFVSGLIGLFIFFLVFLVGIAIMRWAFRINDIVESLDKIVRLLEQRKI